MSDCHACDSRDDVDASLHGSTLRQGYVLNMGEEEVDQHSTEREDRDYFFEECERGPSESAAGKFSYKYFF